MRGYSLSTAQILTGVRQYLPEGHDLPVDVWNTRHRGIVLLLWLHAVVLGILAAALSEFDLAHGLLEGGILAVAAALAGWSRLPRRARACIAGVGLLSA